MLFGKSNAKGKASFNLKKVPSGKFVRCSIKGLESDVYSPGVKIKRKKKGTK